MTDNKNQVNFRIKRAENGYLILISYDTEYQTSDQKILTFVGEDIKSIQKIVETVLNNNFSDRQPS